MFAPNTRVLIVDDMMTMRKLVTKIMKEMGFTDITEAADGGKAWDAVNAAAAPIGLVISDWNMPNVTGLDFLKKVRGDERFAKIPFLLLTAEAEKHQVVEAVKSGVDGYVVKPFAAEALKEALQKVHAKRAA